MNFSAQVIRIRYRRRLNAKGEVAIVNTDLNTFIVKEYKIDVPVSVAIIEVITPGINSHSKSADFTRIHSVGVLINFNKTQCVIIRVRIQLNNVEVAVAIQVDPFNTRIDIRLRRNRERCSGQGLSICLPWK